MNKVKIFLLGLIVCVLLSVPVFAQSWNFSIGTSTIGGSYYIFGSPWAKVISDCVPNATASVQATNGPAENVQLMETGQLQLAYVSAAAGYEGWNGTGWTNGKKYQEMRTLFTTYNSYYELVVLDNSPIKTYRDLEGKKVFFGMPGATPDIAARYICEVLGIKPAQEIAMQTGDAINLLIDGRIDTVAGVYGLPSAMFLDLQSNHKIRFIDMSKEDQEKVCEAYPYFSKGAIPANTYNNQPKDVNTFVFWNYAIGDKDLPEDLVYNIVKAVFENKAEFEAAHTTGKDLFADNIKYAVIPLHPGAVKYYREIGIDIPEELLPPEMK